MRLALLVPLSALFYAAPLAAGLFGVGWAAVPVFAALVMLYNALMGKLGRSPARLALALLVAAGLALALVAGGWGLRALLGAQASAPLWVFAGLGLGATLAARLLLPPGKRADLDAMVEEASGQLEDLVAELDARHSRAPAQDPELAAARAMADEQEALEIRLHKALDALPEDAGRAEVSQAVLPRVPRNCLHGTLFLAMQGRVEGDGGCLRDRNALLVLAGASVSAGDGLGLGLHEAVFRALTRAGSPAEIGAFARAGLALLEPHPEAAEGFPPAAALTDLARRMDDREIAATLRALAARIEMLTEMEGEDMLARLPR